MQYPLTMNFTIFSLANQIKVTDANDESVCFVQQKMFKLKEAVNVFQDKSKQSMLCEIKADRIIDWSACYHFFDSSGESFGAVRRKGMKSIWKAHYDVLDENDVHISSIQEENPMAKVFDSMLGEVPVIGMLTSFLFHPKYLLKSVDGEAKLRMTKQPALFETKYQIDKLVDYDPVDELRALMAFLMMALLEKKRG